MVKVKKEDLKVKMDMTPMIDIVFLLLVFFILTLKIVTAEGDFNIKMPISAAASNTSDNEPPTAILLFLKASGDGSLSHVKAGERTFQGTKDGLMSLRQFLRNQLGPGGTPAAAVTEVELACDYNLRYRNVINVITACTGYVENGQVLRMIERIKFRDPTQ